MTKPKQAGQAANAGTLVDRPRAGEAPTDRIPTGAVREGAGWREIPRAGLILSPGNAAAYETGDWRTFRPVWHPDRCIQCLLCWVYCPDASIQVRDGKVVGVDYDHCKGCGICATECPDKAHALTMTREGEAKGVEV